MNERTKERENEGMKERKYDLAYNACGYELTLCILVHTIGMYEYVCLCVFKCCVIRFKEASTVRVLQ